MARTRIAPVALSRDGIAPAAEQNGDPVNGHVVPNSGRTMIEVRNADAAGAHQVTFITPGVVDGQPVGDRLESIPASTSRRFGRFPATVYGSALAIDVDSAQLKIAVYEP